MTARPPDAPAETLVDLDRIDALAERRGGGDELQERGRFLLFRLFALVKLARLYDIGNEAYPAAIGRLLEALARFGGGGVAIHLLGEGAFVNRVLLDRDPELIERAQFLTATFGAAGVSEIDLLPGVTADHVRDLISSLQASARARETGAAAPLDGASFGMVRLRRVGQANTREAMEKMAHHRVVHAYAVARVLLREHLAELARGRQPTLATPKRLLHDLIAAAGQGAWLLLAVAADPAGASDATDHLLGTAAAALVMGARLAPGRHALLRIGMAALLHDPARGDVDPEGELLHDRDALLHLAGGVRALVRYRGRTRDAVERVVSAYEHGVLAAGVDDLPFGAGPVAQLVAVAHTYDALQRTGRGRPGLLPDEAVRVVVHAFRRAPAALLLLDALGAYPPGSVIETNGGLALVGAAPAPGVPADRPIVWPLRRDAASGWHRYPPVDLAAPEWEAVEILGCRDPRTLGINPSGLPQAQR